MLEEGCPSPYITIEGSWGFTFGTCNCCGCQFGLNINLEKIEMVCLSQYKEKEPCEHYTDEVCTNTCINSHLDNNDIIRFIYNVVFSQIMTRTLTIMALGKYLEMHSVIDLFIKHLPDKVKCIILENLDGSNSVIFARDFTEAQLDELLLEHNGSIIDTLEGDNNFRLADLCGK